MRKRQNGKCNIQNFRRFFFGMNTDVPEFKVPFLQAILNFELSKWILLVDIWSQILLIILLSTLQGVNLNVYIITHTKEKPSTTIDTFRKISKTIEVKRVSKIWIRMSTTYIHLLQFARFTKRAPPCGWLRRGQNAHCIMGKCRQTNATQDTK